MQGPQPCSLRVDVNDKVQERTQGESWGEGGRTCLLACYTHAHAHAHAHTRTHAHIPLKNPKAQRIPAVRTTGRWTNSSHMTGIPHHMTTHPAASSAVGAAAVR